MHRNTLLKCDRRIDFLISLIWLEKKVLLDYSLKLFL